MFAHRSFTPLPCTEVLWEFLEQLGVGKDEAHPHFGKGKDAMHKLEATR